MKLFSNEIISGRYRLFLLYSSIIMALHTIFEFSKLKFFKAEFYKILRDFTKFYINII